VPPWGEKDKVSVKALLVLADGMVFEGRAFGCQGEATGEVVFNTSMTGYQEILTDPSYRGQIVTMTYPQIGNYGINPEDNESSRVWAAGFIVKEYCPVPSNWRSGESLGHFLERQRIPGIEGIDTRALTKYIRDKGAQQGIISSVDLDPKSLLEKARSAPGLVGRDLVRDVACQKPYSWKDGRWVLGGQVTGRERSRGRTFSALVYDFGVKRNILRSLVDSGCNITVVPASTPAHEALAREPDGIFLSNGPGDPEGVPYAVQIVRDLLGKKPIFGICLGHQLLGLALGGRTYKLKFGHHGGNHPVKDLTTGRVEITAQNHGFAVDIDSLKGKARLTHINLYDKTVEGMECPDVNAFSVQYHPEASPGPHDASYLFHRFREMMGAAKKEFFPSCPKEMISIRS